MVHQEEEDITWGKIYLRKKIQFPNNLNFIYRYDPGFGNVGRGDLDPLGRLGGGMIFPHGQIPGGPGSGLPRFDPFGPINPNRNNRGPPRFGPDNDQFEPPGNNGFDDYYM